MSYTYGVAVDTSGNWYVASSTQSRVFKVATNGTITTVAGNGTSGFSGDGGLATNAQLNSPSGVAVDTAGNLYIADSGNYRIRKVSTAGVITTVAGNGTNGNSGDGGLATSAQIGSAYGVAVDGGGGNLYIADRGARIRKVSGGVITTVAGNGTSGFSGDGGPATSAQLNNAYGVAVDGVGNLYIADTYNFRVRKVSGGTITTIAGTGTGGYSGDGGAATSAQINFAYGVAVDGGSNLYIADSGRVRKVSGGVITTIAGTGAGGYSGDGGPATSAQINYASSVAVDSAGNNVSIADSNNYRLRRVTGGVITTIAGNGSFEYSGDNGPATSAQLNPTGIASDNAGNLYIADSLDYRVRKVSGGVITTIAGTGAGGYSGDGGPATSAAISNVPGVAVDGSGNLYIADGNNYRIRKVSTSGVISTIAGTGSQGYSGDGGPATSAQIGFPSSITVDSTGSNLYIADSDNARVRKVSGGVITLVAGGGPPDGVSATTVSIQSLGAALDSAGNVYFPAGTQNRVYRLATNGTITTVAGTGSTGFSGDGGLATSAQLNSPSGVAVDTAGNLYIADSANYRIRKVSTSGVISTIAGAGSQGYSGDGGPATSAQISYIYGVAVDGGGNNLYIADTNNFRVRKVSGGTITTIAGTGTPGSLGDGGLATSAQISFTNGVALDSGGNLYIADGGNYRVRKVSGGVITTVAGTGTFGYSGDGGAATSAQIGYTNGVAVDGAGNLYITDSNASVRKVSGGVITTIAGNGSAGFSGDGGPPTSAQINNAYGVAVDSAGANLYIADTNNRRIRKVSGGVISTVAGNGSLSYSGDGGPAATAQLGTILSGLAVDSGGNLYISDSGNNRVRVMSSGGTITTFAGGGIQGTQDGVAATSATLSSPRGLAVDAAGSNVYIADRGNQILRKVSGGVINTIATIAGVGGAIPGDGGVAVNSGAIYVSDPPDSRVRMLSLVPAFQSITTPGTSGTSGLFSLQYSVPTGNANIYRTQIAINDFLRGFRSCLVYYTDYADVMYLLDDLGSTWLGPIHFGSPGVLRNSQCALDMGQSTRVLSANNLTLNLYFTFNPGFGGTKSVFTEIMNTSAQSLGWQTVGSYTVTAGANSPPSIDSLVPSSGSGSNTVFRFQVSDPDGGGDVDRVQVIFQNGFNPSNSCYVYYAVLSGLVYLANDNPATFQGPVQLGQSVFLQNSQCMLRVGTSSVSYTSNSIEVDLDIAFKSPFAGSKTVYVETRDRSEAGANNWRTMGTWTAVGFVDSTPTVDSVSPSSGSGVTQAFTFRFSDANGYTDLDRVQMLFNNSLNFGTGCLFQYVRGPNLIYLRNDAGTAWLGPVLLGSASTLQNTRCSLNVGSATASGAGNTLQLVLPMTFQTPAFSGLKNTYGEATDNWVVSSNWITLGTWNVP